MDELRTALFEYYEIIEAGFSLYVSRSPLRYLSTVLEYHWYYIWVFKNRMYAQLYTCGY